MATRLARKVAGTSEDLPVLKPKVKIGGINLYIAPYSEKSIVVTGETNDHSAALVALGGSYNTGLRIGSGWIFAKFREASIRHYIETGEINPYIHSKEEREKYNNNTNNAGSRMDEKMMLSMFQEFRDAFDANEEYDGQSVHEVIFQLQEKYLPKPKVRTIRKTAPKDGDDGDGEMSSE